MANAGTREPDGRVGLGVFRTSGKCYAEVIPPGDGSNAPDVHPLSRAIAGSKPAGQGCLGGVTEHMLTPCAASGSRRTLTALQVTRRETTFMLSKFKPGDRVQATRRIIRRDGKSMIHAGGIADVLRVTDVGDLQDLLLLPRRGAPIALLVTENTPVVRVRVA